MLSGSEQFRQSFDTYLQFAKRVCRQRVLIISLFLLGLALSAAAAYILPPVYQSSTLILVQQQKLSPRYVESAVSVDLNKRLTTLAPQIMSRARLERIMKKFDPYDTHGDPLLIEGKIETMRKAIEVQVKGEDTFRVAYRHSSADVAQKITSEIARLFISENLGDRSKQAMTTFTFLDRELEEFKSKLDAQEDAIRKYRSRYFASLPMPDTPALRSLSPFSSPRGPAAAAKTDAMAEDPFSQLNRLKSELREKKAQYTDLHPEVRALTLQIAQMERQLSASPKTENTQDDQAAQKNGRLRDAEGVFATLSRDYETARDNYRALLNKKFESMLSVSLERSTQENAFKILDPAYFPMEPESPNRQLIILLGGLGSLALGIGLAFFRETMDTTIRTELDLKNVSTFPVLVVIPTLIPYGQNDRVELGEMRKKKWLSQSSQNDPNA